MAKLKSIKKQFEIYNRGVLIIFGPNFMKAAAETLKSKDEIMNEFDGNIIFSCESLEDLTIPNSLTPRCIINFTHYLPVAKGRAVTNEEMKLWGDQLFSDINIYPELSDGKNPQFKRATLVGNKTDNEVLLFMRWGNVNTDFCVAIAKEFENSYKANNGYYNPN